MDLRRYLNKEPTKELLTTQGLVGYKYMFHGWVMKNLLNVQEHQTNVMKKINKIIIKKSMNFYSSAWKHRNDMFHDETKYKIFVGN